MAKAKKTTPKSEITSDMSKEQRLAVIVAGLAQEYGFSPSQDEVVALVEDQFLHPRDRDVRRFHRQANEMLCQHIERDKRFIEAVELAKA